MTPPENPQDPPCARSDQSDLTRTAIGGEDRALAVVREIHNSKKEKQPSRKQGGRLEPFFSRAPAGFFIVDDEFRFVRVNEAAAKVNGLPVEEHIGKKIQDAAPSLASSIEPFIREVLATGCERLNVELSGSHSRAGGRRHRLASFFPVPGADKKRQVGSLIVEVTKRSERGQPQGGSGERDKAIREIEERFRLIAETIEEAFWISDIESGRICYVSPGYERLWGRSVKSLYEDPASWRDAIHPEDREPVLTTLSRERAGLPFDIEYRIVRGDGAIRWVWDRGFPTKDHTGRITRYVGVARDITERKEAEKVRIRLEAQLLQAQKMEAVGRLAGGVAHDFNNLLTVINGYASMTLTSLSNHHPGREDLEEIVLAGERAADFARQLLAFSRRQVLQPEVLDLNVTVAAMNKMLTRLISEDIELVTITEPELGRVMADPGQIEQVIMNLVVNARDAMPMGGKLVIETANELVTSYYAHTRPGMHEGDFVTLSVSDNGCGMDKETLTRIFEPFFTTKEKGKGTGLGLCTTYGIVKQSDGYIGVQSEPGRGTTFKIYLPRTGQDGSGPQKASDGESQPVRGAETVLLVEDEENLRKLTMRVLERNGYRVYPADTGAAALKVWQEYPGAIDLLLTDMVMPGGLNGRQLAERLRSDKMDLKVIYASGHNDEMIGIAFPLPAGFSFLRKPFNPSKLLQTVRDSLDGR
jgi:PAS domain S-box-containing protein